jgi:MFS family permease
MLVPQPDCPLPGGAGKFAFAAHVRATFRNRELRLLALVHAVIALGNIAGPFGPAYCLREVGLSYFGLGLLNAVSTAAVLIASPVWGRLVDRFGCRPILVVGLCIIAPTSAVWLFIPPGARHMAYVLLPWTNFIGGAGGAAIGVAISTMMYKLSKPEGRSVQFATYSVFVTLVGMPMAWFGGWLVTHLQAAGYNVDLRITFWIWSLFIVIAAALAWRLKEPQSVGVRALVFDYFPDMVARFWDSVNSIPVLGTVLRLPWPGSRGKDPQQGPGNDKRA